MLYDFCRSVSVLICRDFIGNGEVQSYRTLTKMRRVITFRIEHLTKRHFSISPLFIIPGSYACQVPLRVIKVKGVVQYKFRHRYARKYDVL